MTTPLRAETRHMCRKCRGRLPEPTGNLRKAFCTRGCWEQHHWTRCVVCENPIQQKGRRRWLCKRPKCRTELRKWPTIYRPFDGSNYRPFDGSNNAVGYLPTGANTNTSKNPIKRG
jgi:hypothetical protein